MKEQHSESGLRKNRSVSPVSEIDFKQAYKLIQMGGEIPTSGLCLPHTKKKGNSFLFFFSPFLFFFVGGGGGILLF